MDYEAPAPDKDPSNYLMQGYKLGPQCVSLGPYSGFFVLFCFYQFVAILKTTNKQTKLEFSYKYLNV